MLIPRACNTSATACLPIYLPLLLMWRERNRYGRVEPETETEELVQIYEESCGTPVVNILIKRY